MAAADVSPAAAGLPHTPGSDEGGTPAGLPSPSSPGAAPGGCTTRRSRAGHGGPLRELGALAAWSVTSAKPGNGLELLRDGSCDTYWQSDGTQPHLVNIQFTKRVELEELHIYLDFRADESYTPSRLALRAGSSYHDLRDVCIVELREPVGWSIVQLSPHGRPLRAFLLQVAVLANHQNGRDTHIRQVLLFGPPAHATGRSAARFEAPELGAFATIR